MPFTLSYQLNTDYNNGSDAYQAWLKTFQTTDNAGATATQQVENFATWTKNTTVVLGLTVVAFLLVGGWIAWKELTRRG